MNKKEKMEHIEVEQMLKRIDNIAEANVEEGICHLIGYTSEERLLIIEIFKSWDEFSGNEIYPISHPTLGSKIGYYKTHNKWDKRTTYGKSRWRALFYLKEELKKLI